MNDNDIQRLIDWIDENVIPLVLGILIGVVLAFIAIVALGLK